MEPWRLADALNESFVYCFIDFFRQNIRRFCINGQIYIILGFVEHMVSFTATLLFHCSAKAKTVGMEKKSLTYRNRQQVGGGKIEIIQK